MENHPKIFLRKADFSDIEFLFSLRNQPSTYQYAKNARPVEWSEHIGWITPIIKGNSSKNLFVIEFEGKKAGQARIDIAGEGAEVSISLLAEFQGKGIAAIALKMAMDKIAEEKGVKIFIAEIHQDNIPSQKLFEKLGFQFKNQEGVWKAYVKTT